MAEALAADRCPPHLAPFRGLADTDTENETDAGLFDKLASDRLLQTYSIYGLFPGLYQRIYRNRERPELTFDGRTRRRVAIFRFQEPSENPGLVVKPLQSRREGEIAQLAGAAQVGPTQYPSLAGFITEEFVPGVLFTDLATQRIADCGNGNADGNADTDTDTNTDADAIMYRIGRNLGGMLARLHRQQIYYNDATLSDPAGRSHLIVPPNWAVNASGNAPPGGNVGSDRSDRSDRSQSDAGNAANDNSGYGCRLIDFGVSLRLDNHPRLEPEEVYNFVRTLPEFRLFSGMGLGGRELGRFLEQYRQRLAGVSKEAILNRDLRFVDEGLRLAARRLGDSIQAPFRAGFGAAYG